MRDPLSGLTVIQDVERRSRDEPCGTDLDRAGSVVSATVIHAAWMTGCRPPAKEPMHPSGGKRRGWFEGRSVSTILKPGSSACSRRAAVPQNYEYRPVAAGSLRSGSSSRKHRLVTAATEDAAKTADRLSVRAIICGSLVPGKISKICASPATIGQHVVSTPITAVTLLAGRNFVTPVLNRLKNRLGDAGQATAASPFSHCNRFQLLDDRRRLARHPSHLDAVEERRGVDPVKPEQRVVKIAGRPRHDKLITVTGKRDFPNSLWLRQPMTAFP